MLGFAIEPDGSDVRTSFLRTGNGISDSLNSNMELKVRAPLYKALVSYWAIHKGHISKAQVPARLFIKQSFPQFFSQLMTDTSTEDAGEMDGDELYACLEEKHVSMNTVWEHVRIFGSRLWDGIRRVWGWFRNIIRHIGGAITAFIKDLSRLVYQYALYSYETVKTVIRGFCESVAYLVSPEVALPAAMMSRIHHDGDCDFIILVDESYAPADVTAEAELLEIKSCIFRISTYILSTLVAALKSVAAGIAGWAWLLSGLLRLHRCIVRLAPELIELQKRIPA